MLGFFDYWRQEAQGRYTQVSDDVSNGEKFISRGPISLPFIAQKIYQVAPFLLLFNLVFAAIWAVQGASHVLKRPRTFAPQCKI